jgi:DNA-binding MltR family transcriptional regulator
MSDDVATQIVKSANFGRVSSDEIGKILVAESDRGCALFGACILDDELELLLRSLFRSEYIALKDHIDPLFKGDAVLATFSSRIKLAFALGLITHKVFKTLNLIRKIRNDFAHTTGLLDFDDPRCRDRWNIISEEWKPVLPRDADGNILSAAKKIGFVFAVESVAKQIRVVKELVERLEEVKGFKSLILRLEKDGL